MTEQRRPRQPLGAYEVGYGKPPVSTQFRKGTSGNPKGRPKTTVNKIDVANKVLSRVIIMQGPKGPEHLTVWEGAVCKQAQLALKGDPRSFAALLRLVEREMKQAAADDPAAAEPSQAEIVANILINMSEVDRQL